MDWSDEGIFLGAKPLGEANAVAELFTLGHGRHLGLVRGGRSRRLRPLLQPGNLLARHLAGAAFGTSRRLQCRADRGACRARTRRCGARSPPSARLRAWPASCPSATRILSFTPRRSTSSTPSTRPELWPALLVRWELQLLQELGFGLDLSECAATGDDAELVYVSPRSGRAVSREAGQPYCSKLLKLPAFLRDDDAAPARERFSRDLRSRGHFLERDVLAPHGLAMPQAERAPDRPSRAPASKLPRDRMQT